MAEITLTPRPLLGADILIGENRIGERGDLSLFSVAMPRDGDAAVEEALRGAYGLSLPDPRISAVSDEVRSLRLSPDQLLLILPGGGDGLAEAVSDAGYVTDQSDGWVTLEISGPDTMAALERICMLDLSDAAFPPGAYARTMMEHMGAIILRPGPEREFLLLCAASSARDFIHAVETSYRNVLAN